MHILLLLLIALLLPGAAHAQAIAGSITLRTPVLAAGASVGRTLSSKLGDQLSVLDFGAKCDGTADDSAAVLAAGATGQPIGIPGGLVCNAPGALGMFGGAPGLFIGPGKLKDAGGYVHNAVSGAISAPPNPASWIGGTTNQNDPCAASFTCGGQWDFRHVLPPEEWVITDPAGGHTLGQPAGGYQYMPGAIPHQAFFSNSSGWNQSPSNNSGRTAAVYSRLIAQQNGAGDMLLHEGEVLCGGQGGHPTAAGGAATTDWLANPNCTWEAGDISAIAADQYLQIHEWHVNDNGNDVAAVGTVHGYNRTFAGTPGMNNRWIDALASCLGATACDAASVIQGKWRIGIDLTEVGTQINAAMAMIAGQRVYLNSSYGDGEGNPGKANLGGDWLAFDPASNTIQLADAGAAALQVSNPAGAVNHWAITGSTPGGYVNMAPVGSDAAIGVLLQDKAGAGLVEMSNGAVALKVQAPANASGFLQASPGAPGQGYALQVLNGSPTDLDLSGAGSGLVRLVGGVPGVNDSSNAAAPTSMVQNAVTSMTANRMKLANLGGGAQLPVVVPAGVINAMVVEIVPNAATIPSLQLTMPAAMPGGGAIPDGFIVRFICTATVTTFTTPGNTGQAVLGAPGTITPTTPFGFLWDAGLASWVRV